MKVLLLDDLPAVALEQLKAQGFSFVVAKAADNAVDMVKTHAPQALVVRSRKVTSEILDAGPGITLVVRAGSGVDTIDLPGCSRRGVFVASCAGKNAAAVAELVFGLILALDRRIPEAAVQLKDARWNKKALAAPARGLMGRVLGVLGMGAIGRLVAERGKAFGMRVVAWDPLAKPEMAEVWGVELLSQPDDVAAFSDVVSVHLALTPQTRGLCGKNFFSAMRRGSVFINASRGELLDEPALLAALDARDLRAGLDVFAGEPSGGEATFENALARHPRVVATPHLGASTQQAQDAIALETVRILREYRDTGRVPTAVNLARATPATHLLTVRHLDRVGVLAHVLNGLRAAGVNVQEMENVIFDGAHAALARIHLDRAVEKPTLDTIQAANGDILELRLIALTPAAR
jgi:D-3-phosphoglycerate dehydrogenase